MPRKPRLEYPGAVYHLTARGIRQIAIFVDDHDRGTLLRILVHALRAFEAQVFAFCLMGNHYHLVLQTHRANLSALMHDVNSRYSMGFNQRHTRRGHVLEGRFKALHVDRDAYLLQVCRYVELNPVRASLVDSPARWRWSSYRAHAGSIPSPAWLATAELHGALTGRIPEDDVQREDAQRRYAEWVDAGREVRLWKESLRRGRYLGDEAFVERLNEFRA